MTTPSQRSTVTCGVDKYYFQSAIIETRRLDLREPTWSELRRFYREAVAKSANVKPSVKI